MMLPVNVDGVSRLCREVVERAETVLAGEGDEHPAGLLIHGCGIHGVRHVLIGDSQPVVVHAYHPFLAELVAHNGVAVEVMKFLTAECRGAIREASRPLIILHAPHLALLDEVAGHVCAQHLVFTLFIFVDVSHVGVETAEVEVHLIGIFTISQVWAEGVVPYAYLAFVLVFSCFFYAHQIGVRPAVHPHVARNVQRVGIAPTLGDEFVVQYVHIEFQAYVLGIHLLAEDELFAMPHRNIHF